ncbi:MAG: tol-pal system-associated acyl-CoA thioesterase, partial [Xanthomonadaceae bacterium]|nr:tol-pal system-associated acyl-CoA thioesterase [Xanthomonadaceae bacterium]
MSAAVVFSWPVRVYWEDTDAGGVVYHAAYLRFLERARTEWLRACGVEQARVREQHGVLFVVADLSVKFHLPARLDDALCVDITAFTRRSASMRFAQCILRPADGVLLIEADVRAACIDATSYKPRRIPDSLLS